ncbi:MAG: hypothetical protein ACRYGP_19670 [Janthinobacterium lividum]
MVLPIALSASSSSTPYKSILRLPVKEVGYCKIAYRQQCYPSIEAVRRSAAMANSRLDGEECAQDRPKPAAPAPVVKVGSIPKCGTVAPKSLRQNKLTPTADLNRSANETVLLARLRAIKAVVLFIGPSCFAASNSLHGVTTTRM